MKKSNFSFIKSVTALFFVFFIAQSSFSQSEVNWLSIQEVEVLNKKEPRKILFFFETSWCGNCKAFDRTVMQDSKIASYLNENYYTVRFDGETKQSVTFDGIEYNFDSTYGSRGANELAIDMMQGFMAYPSVIFLEEDFTSIRLLRGQQPKDLFSTFLSYINTDAYLTQDWFVYSGQETSTDN